MMKHDSLRVPVFLFALVLATAGAAVAADLPVAEAPHDGSQEAVEESLGLLAEPEQMSGGQCPVEDQFAVWQIFPAVFSQAECESICDDLCPENGGTVESALWTRLACRCICCAE